MGSSTPASKESIATRSMDTETFRPDPRGNLTVITYTQEDLAIVATRVRELDGVVVAGSQTSLRISMEASHVEALVTLPEVKWVEPYLPPKLHNDIASGIMGVRPVWEAHGLDGEGQIIGVADTGLDTGVDDQTMSPEFRGRIAAILSWPIQPGYRASLSNTAWDDGAADQDSGHGTHVAGSVLGSGALSDGSIQGIAPRAHMVFQAVEQWVDWKRGSGYQDGYYLLGLPDDLGQLFGQAYEHGVRVHTNSWGDSLHGQYSVESQTIDQFLWDHKDMTILFSAGNDGTDGNRDGVVDPDSLASQACAKNCIAVGASENQRDTGGFNPGGMCSTYGGCWQMNFPVAPLRHDRISDNPDGMVAFSSRGPADDGRIKPDVVAPGTNILSVRSSQTNDSGWGLLPPGDPYRQHYMFMGGTSMATPLAAGAAALIRQYLERVHVHQPTGALVKAVLIHGAAPLAGQYNPPEVQPPPDINQGWGRVNVQNALFPPHPTHWKFRDDPTDAVGAGEVRNYQFEVVDASVPLRTTLVWTDFPSSPGSGGGLVNRLRVSFVAPDGAITQGGPLNNNVQQATIAIPQPGVYTVRVIGLNVVSQVTANAKQDFALVVSGGLAFVDLYVRDDEVDNGVEPRSQPRYRSPDIWVSAVADPSAPALANAEPGKPNYVFVRVHNRGSSAASDAAVRLIWTRLGTHPARRLWSAKGIQVDGRAANVQRVAVPAHHETAPSEAVTAAFAWTPPPLASAKPNYYCLLATVSHPADPLLHDDTAAVRWEDNLAWRSIAVQAIAPGQEASFPFYITGLDSNPATATLRIDCRGLPAGSRVRLKLPSRHLQGATPVNLRQVWQSPAGVLCRLEVTDLSVAELAGVPLKTRENTLLRLEALLPDTVAPGHDYPITVEHRMADQIAGCVNLLLRSTG
jgi:subtilisin family serine protease